MLSLPFLSDYVMLSSSSAELSSLKYTFFFVPFTLCLRFITVGGSRLPVNQTGTIINLSSHYFQPLSSKDGNVIFWFKDCNHILISRLTLLIASVPEPGSGGKVNEDFCFKLLYNFHNSISHFHYKELLRWFGIFNNITNSDYRKHESCWPRNFLNTLIFLTQ